MLNPPCQSLGIRRHAVWILSMVMGVGSGMAIAPAHADEVMLREGRVTLTVGQIYTQPVYTQPVYVVPRPVYPAALPYPYNSGYYDPRYVPQGITIIGGEIEDATLINPVIIDSQIEDSRVINPITGGYSPSQQTRPSCQVLSHMRSACQ